MFKRKGFLLIVIASLSIITQACKSKSNIDVATGFQSFLATDEKVLMFGSIDVSSILKKSEAYTFPKIGVAVKNVSKKIFAAFHEKTPVRFATKTEGNNFLFYGFMDVKNKDSLTALFKDYGYTVEAGNGFDYMEEEDLTVGFNDKIAVLIIRPKAMEAKALLAKTFEQIASGKTAETNAIACLNSEGDIVLSQLFGGIQSALTSESDKADVAKVNEVIKGSYFNSVFNFENGKVDLKTKALFTDKLKARFFMKDGNRESTLAKLGSGAPRIGFSANIDVDKMDAFMTDFLPGMRKRLGEQIEATLMFFAPGVEAKNFSNILAGDLAVLIGLEGDSFNGGIPQLNASIGFGKQGEQIQQAIAGKASLIGASKINDNTFKYEGGTYIVTAKGIKGQTMIPGASLIMPNGSEKFGNGSISLFANLENLNISSFGFGDGANVIEIVKFLRYNATSGSGEGEIVVKNPNTNVLKQVLDYFQADIEKRVGSLNI